MQPFAAAGQRHQRDVERAFDEADPQVCPGQRGHAFVQVLDGRHPIDADRRRQARQHAHQRGARNQQGRHQQHAQQARQHQVFDGVDAQRAQGVDLFVGFHRAQLGSKGRADAAGQNHARHQPGQLAHHAHGHHIGNEALRADAGQLRAAHVGQHQADERAGEQHDGQAGRAGLVDLAGQVRAAHHGAAARQAAQRQQHFAEKGDGDARVGPPVAQPAQHRVVGRGLVRHGVLGRVLSRERQIECGFNALGQRVQHQGDALAPERRQQAPQRGGGAGVPFQKLAGVDGDGGAVGQRWPGFGCGAGGFGGAPVAGQAQGPGPRVLLPVHGGRGRVRGRGHTRDDAQVRGAVRRRCKM